MSDDEDDDVFKPVANNAKKGRATKRRKTSVEESEDEFGLDAATQEAMLEEGMQRHALSLMWAPLM